MCPVVRTAQTMVSLISAVFRSSLREKEINSIRQQCSDDDSRQVLKNSAKRCYSNSVCKKNKKTKKKFFLIERQSY